MDVNWKSHAPSPSFVGDSIRARIRSLIPQSASFRWTMSGLFHVVLILFTGIAAPCSSAQAIARMPNTTVRMPQNPSAYGFTTVDAFPGLIFDNPVCIVSPPGETNRVFVLEKGGRIQVITNLANPNKTLFLDISSRTRDGGDGGLLGLAFHPGYLTNHYFFLFYSLDTSTASGNGPHARLARFEFSPVDPNRALANSEVPFFTQLHESDAHYGGDLHFGLDDYLYVSLGDGDGGDPNSQRIDGGFFSGILRIDVDRRLGNLLPHPHPAASTNYAIPADNPFVGAVSFNGVAVNPNSVRTEFWALGLRVPWRMFFDKLTGDLYCSDNGEDDREEINLIVKGGNYGWNYWEGSLLTGIRTPPVGLAVIAPILEYGQVGTSGDASLKGDAVIGGVIYRGNRLSQITGEYIFGDYVSGNIWALHVEGAAASNFRQLTTASSPSAFGIDPSNGDVLIGQIDTGRILRLAYNAIPVGVPLPPTLADTGAFGDVTALAPNPGIVPYDLNVAFWSDYARKARWFSVPDTNLAIGFNPTGNWSFPTGSVWIKHFELQLTNGIPESARRVETRFLVRNAQGVYGATYRWGGATTNAVLVVEEGMDEVFQIHDGGVVRTQVWHYPSRSECLRCHTALGGQALGFNTFQLNRDHDYSVTITNQLRALSLAGYFSNAVSAVTGLPAYASVTNESASVEHRVRSYLGANCVYCHQPGGTGRGYWDARLLTPLESADIVNGRLLNSDGNLDLKVVKPGSIGDSIMFQRIAELGSRHMPPLATAELNQEAIALLARWITNDLVSLGVRFPAGVATYFTGADPVVLDPNASITSWVSLTNGTLTLAFTTNGAAEDRLRVHHVGGGSGQVGVSGNALSYSGAALGTYSGGIGGADPLVINFNTNATQEAAQAVLQNVTYQNVSTAPATTPRTVMATLAASGAVSSPALLIISVLGGPPAHLGSVISEANGGLRIYFTGQIGRLYRVEASQTLTNWITIGTAQTGPAGTGEFVDLRPEGLATRFYRLAWP